jgi:hypothetical protein
MSLAQNVIEHFLLSLAQNVIEHFLLTHAHSHQDKNNSI